MKRLNLFLITMICFLSVFSGAFAFDSIFDKTNSLLTEEKNAEAVRTVGSITLDSIQSLGESNEGMESLFQALSSLRIDYASQNGSAPMASFSLSMADYPIISYALQSTTPYFISSNFLGEKYYMINDEDKFEEKFVDAIYRMVETSGIEAELPDINEVYTIIQSIRDGSISTSSISAQQSFEFTGEIDTSALEPLMFKMMMKFSETTPTERDSYFYTDILLDDLKFSWPDEETLPAFPVLASAITGTFTQADLLDILNAFSQFFAANQELREAVNQAIAKTLAQAKPEMADMEGKDLITEFLNSLQESVETDLKDFTLTINIDQGEYGEPILFTIESGIQTEAGNNGTTIHFLMNNDLNGSVYEFAVDSAGQEEIPLPVLRGLVSAAAGEEGNSVTDLNFRFTDGISTAFEYTQQTENYTATTMTDVSDTDINFDFNGEQGSVQVFSTGIPNEFGGKDNTAQITYTHTSQGTPLITATLTGESVMTETAPALTASDAVAASQLSESDYDQLVSEFFTNILMLTMMFQ